MDQRSIFDSFVDINKLYGAVSLVYAKKRYFLFVEFLKPKHEVWKKNITLWFYDDLFHTVPDINHCHYRDAAQKRIKFGVFENEKPNASIREWMHLTHAISSTWQVPAEKLIQWHDALQGSLQQPSGNLSILSFGVLNFNVSASPQLTHYKWAEYKLSQLAISSYMLHM